MEGELQRVPRYRNSTSTVLLFCALTAALSASAQHPHWRTTIGPVERNGHHLILLSPEVVARSQASLNDIRLLAPDSTLVPYLTRTEPERVSEVRAVPFSILRNERVGKRTVVEFEVPAGTLMDGFELGIRNAQVNKSARITGSDDRTHWFMVKDEGLALSGDGAARGLRWMDLPLSDHRYYRIELNDSLTAPVQVLGVGHTVQARSEGQYVSAGNVRWDRHEEKGRTLFRIYGDHPLVIDRLRYTTSDTMPFRRLAELATIHRSWQTERRNRKVLRTEREVFSTGTLASYQRAVIEGPYVAVDTLYLEVQNGDDRPLAITSLEALQLQRSLIAPLSAGLTYTLTTGDPQASAPQFDIAHFRDSLPTPIDTLKLASLIAIPTVVSEEKPFDPSKAWIWVAIGVIGGLSAFGAVRALRKKEA
ncbi:MAG: hypothetical protein IPN85_11935 [Flavobacteriales bacterium]|nr:hypothetical protein [Flavobacteriales bacterium]